MFNDARSLIKAQLRRLFDGSLGRFRYGLRSFSQEGEDLVLQRLFADRPFGTYVDIGAHHPFRFSNTALLSQRGWRGANIDARPGSMAAFERTRPRDVNLEVGVAEQEGAMTYYMFEEPALNTFDAAIARKRASSGWSRAGTCEVECWPLSKVMSFALEALRADSVDLLSVDVEGLDLEVLQSNDWSRYVPDVVVVEVADLGLEACLKSRANQFLMSVGYKAHAKLCQSVVYVRAHSLGGSASEGEDRAREGTVVA